MKKKRMIITIPIGGLSTQKAIEELESIREDHTEYLDKYDLIILRESNIGKEELTLIDSSYGNEEFETWSFVVPISGLSRQRADSLILERMETIKSELKLTENDKLIVLPYGDSGYPTIEIVG